MMLIKPKFWDKKISFISFLLLPLSWIVLLFIFFKKKVTIEKSFRIPIVCVGNIYVGGTGKTPVSIFLANELFKLRKNPVILRKYYESHADEHILIKENYKSLLISNNRINGIKEAELSNFDMVIMDDGFQDYKIKKDLNIVCFNQRQKIGNGFVIPSGPLRENLTALRNANIALINGKKDSDFEKKILDINNKLNIFYSTYEPINIEQFKNKNLLAIAGIGNPENFFELLEKNNLSIVKKLIFPDHYKFSKKEIQNIIDIAKRKNYEIIMTEKDYCKIKKFNSDKIKYLKVKIKIKDSERLINKIKELYDQKV